MLWDLASTLSVLIYSFIIRLYILKLEPIIPKCTSFLINKSEQLLAQLKALERTIICQPKF